MESLASRPSAFRRELRRVEPRCSHGDTWVEPAPSAFTKRDDYGEENRTATVYRTSWYTVLAGFLFEAIRNKAPPDVLVLVFEVPKWAKLCAYEVIMPNAYQCNMSIPIGIQ